jgi:hypothetical protein
MIDNPEKTAQLLTALKAAVPFQVAVMPNLINRLVRQQKPVVVKSTETVSDVSYLGDEGGIVCHIQPEDAENVIILSLTHVQVPRSMPLAPAVFNYQKHRAKKLRKQGYN